MSDAAHTGTPVPSLKERVQQFNRMQLPGQPMGMHMGTSYLVNELLQANEALQTERDRLAKRIKSLEAALRVGRGYVIGNSLSSHPVSKADLATIDKALDLST